MWYGQLKPHSVSTFDQLAIEFESNFLASVKPKLLAIALLGLSQKEEEPLSHYVSCFTIEIGAELSYPRPPSPPLNSTRTKIFLQIKEKGLLRTPNPLKGPRELWDRAKYCQFYRDYGHDMEDCHDLYNQIEELIHREYLVHYV
ncbi:hypothetical protein BHE74_00054760 [Ensete ventricosum]|nr:hypothetical protein BHE74_00054760 [Ensete ventricosum]